jgi:pyroglutamyl-peptidase
MNRVLLTGFGPFGKVANNPSWSVARGLDGQVVAGGTVHSLSLPVLYGEDHRLVQAALREIDPQLILLLGVSSGAPAIHVERFAVNLRGAEPSSMPLSEVRDPVSPAPGESLTPICPDGPAAYLATIDCEAVSAEIRKVGVPAEAHSYAGAYLCNHILYYTLHSLALAGRSVPCGFLHLPRSCEDALNEGKFRAASLPLSLLSRGVEAAIQAALPPQ